MLRSLPFVKHVRRSLSSSSLPPSGGDVSSRARLNNVMMAAGLLGFVSTVYYYTLNKIKGKDELQIVIDQEMNKKP
jgi:hypothetical protein